MSRQPFRRLISSPTRLYTPCILKRPQGNMTDEAPIKTMLLYSHIDRIWNELREVGYDDTTAKVIPVELLNKFDCLNYGGAGGAARSVAVLGLDSSQRVLDVGAGLGGPARCVSAVSGAQVTGIELQPDLAELGNTLSKKCGVGDSVKIASGNILDDDLVVGEDTSFDAVMSWLVILHIPLADRRKLFSRLNGLMKSGAKMYIEDFYKRSDFSDHEKELLSMEVYVPDSDLPSKEDYVATVTDAGFDIDFQDVSDIWTGFTTDRRDSWKENMDRHVRVHNLATWESLDRFYRAIAELFQGGNLGGVRIVLTKK